MTPTAPQGPTLAALAEKWERIARGNESIADAIGYGASKHADLAAEARLIAACARAIAILESKGGNWVFRESNTGRGWRLHQSVSGERDTSPTALAALLRAASPTTTEN